MDHLIENVPAPDLNAVVTKLELVAERYQGLGAPSETSAAILEDLRRLASEERPASGSLMLTLHARFESIWTACNRVDVEQPPNDEPGSAKEYYACERAMGDLSAESLLVQQLILRQFPTTDEELTILMMHVANLYEAEQPLSRGEQQAIEIAMQHAFDYLVSEGRADTERLGPQFAHASMLAFELRRHRTGQLNGYINEGPVCAHRAAGLTSLNCDRCCGGSNSPPAPSLTLCHPGERT